MCSIENCLSNEHARGFCNKHYRRFMKYGNPLKAKNRWGHDKNTSAKDRFISKLLIGPISEDGITRHLLYDGAKDKFGYGVFHNTKSIKAHRFLWELWIGPILNDDDDLDHRPECPKNCVNPAHLQLLNKIEHLKLGHKRGELSIIPMLEANKRRRNG